MPKKFLLSLAALAAAFSLAACGADGEDEAASEDTGQSQEQGEEAMPEPELDNIPDVVAVVDGDEISGDDFKVNYEAQFPQLSMQAQMSGEEPEQEQLKEQALEMMINSELLVMEAEDQGFSSSEKEVDEYLEQMAEDNGLESGEELMTELEGQGLSEDRIREDLHKEVMIQQVVEDLDVEEPSEEELQELYDAQVEQLEAMNEQVEEDQQQEVPKFEELEPDLKQQATQQEENEAITKLLDDLREDTDIEIKL